MNGPGDRLRILCIGETWLGSDARAAFAALRRLGHATHVIDEAHFVPTEWSTFAGRAARKLLRGVMAAELRERSRQMMRLLKPDALFVFKGNYVVPEILHDARAMGIRSVNYYPDVSFHTHGPELPRTLPHYDHVFTAKTFGIADMRAHGVSSISFLAPGFDPEVHRPMALTGDDVERLGCDISFIGTWSPKKEGILAGLKEALPQARIRIWGNQWDKRTGRALDDSVMGTGITGDDYSRAICASSICLGLLSEAREGSSSGDLITARTFQIPACGAFMLHEHTSEVSEWFVEDTEAVYFRSGAELASKAAYYLSREAERRAIAEAGLRRSLESDYSADARARVIAAWIHETRDGA